MEAFMYNNRAIISIGVALYFALMVFLAFTPLWVLACIMLLSLGCGVIAGFIYFMISIGHDE